MHKIQHHFFKLFLRQLAMPNSNPGLRYNLGKCLFYRRYGLNPVMYKVNLTATLYFSFNNMMQFCIVPLDNFCMDR